MTSETMFHKRYNVKFVIYPKMWYSLCTCSLTFTYIYNYIFMYIFTYIYLHIVYTMSFFVTLSFRYTLLADNIMNCNHYQTRNAMILCLIVIVVHYIISLKCISETSCYRE